MRSFLAALLVVALATACGGPEEHGHGASGGRYGGIFNLNETEPLRSIFPLTLTQASAFRIISQVYQGLVKFDAQDMSIKPSLAESWEVDATATEYTFHLRKGVRFHDDPAFPDGTGRELVADDVVACFTAICTHGRGDLMFWLFQDRVFGANAYYAATASGGAPPELTGITKVDDHTVRIKLTHPTSNFLQIIAHQGCWIYPHELVDHYANELMQHAIGTGPFQLRTARAGEAMVLERHPHYWEKDAEGRSLPYLEGVRITFADDKAQELEEFLRGHVSAVFEVPVERIGVLGDSMDKATGKPLFRSLSTPVLSSQFYGFNAFRPPFNDVRVRRAFALAIDRRFLVDSVLKGLAVVAAHGLVAPGLPGYPYALVPGVSFAPDRARALLAEAGYPGGKGFPPFTLQVNNDGFGYERVAGTVQEMWQRELNVAATVSVLPADQHYDRLERLQATVWREGWIADHPDPENFLALLYGKNTVLDTALPTSLNNTRYHSSEFDRLFATALNSTDQQERMNDLAQAERVAMNDMPLVPLYHERAVWLLRNDIRGLHLNALEGLDLSAVWFEHQ